MVEIIATLVVIANQTVITNAIPVAPTQQNPIASATVDYKYQLPLELFQIACYIISHCRL